MTNSELVHGASYLPHLDPSAEIALQEKAKDIVVNYVNGNKADARDIFGTVKATQIAYVTMFVLEFFERYSSRDGMKFICSVTTC